MTEEEFNRLGVGDVIRCKSDRTVWVVDTVAPSGVLHLHSISNRTRKDWAATPEKWEKLMSTPEVTVGKVTGTGPVIEAAQRVVAAHAVYRNVGGKHYKGLYEPFDVILEWQKSWPTSVRFHCGNIVKYIARLGRKDDVEKELEKLIVYAQEALEVIRRERS